MKYTLFGFNQRVAYELNLDLIDLALIRWFIDYKDAKGKNGKPKMVSKIIDGEKMYWVKYSGVIKEFPILKFKSEDSVYRRFKKLALIGILNHKTVRSGGTYSFYCVGSQYYNLLSDEYEIKSDTNPSKSDTNPSKSEINPEQNINLLNNKSINNKSTKEKEQSSESSLFDSSERVRKIIKETLDSMSNMAYDMWFKDTTIKEYEDKVSIRVSKELFSLMPSKYIKQIEIALQKHIELIENDI